MYEMRNECRSLVGKPDRKRTIVRSKRRWNSPNKIKVKIRCGVRDEFIWLGTECNEL
jgi:hypothetical protein